VLPDTAGSTFIALHETLENSAKNVYFCPIAKPKMFGLVYGRSWLNWWSGIGVGGHGLPGTTHKNLNFPIRRLAYHKTDILSNRIFSADVPQEPGRTRLGCQKSLRGQRCKSLNSPRVL
jgi:hypothetical protein